jgi:hypothetical protein
LGIHLRTLADQVDQVPDGHVAAVGEPVGQALLLHEVGEDAGVAGEAGDGDADMLVDGEELLLVGGEFFGVALEREVVWLA